MDNEYDRYGGRLALVRPAELDAEQQDVWDRLLAVQVPEAATAGFTARTPDGRFIGPFNAYVRFAPAGAGLLTWAAAQVRSGDLSAAARQVVTLAVGAEWGAAYEIEAHVAGALTAGITADAVAAILRGEDHPTLDAECTAARRLAASLLVEHRVPQSDYDAHVVVLGEDGIAAVAHLVGQYVAVSALLIAFDVPAVGDSTLEEESCRS